jgi:hypothetical protein
VSPSPSSVGLVKLALVGYRFLIFDLQDRLRGIRRYYFTFEMKPKSVTLAFKRKFSEAGFGEITVPVF